MVFEQIFGLLNLNFKESFRRDGEITLHMIHILGWKHQNFRFLNGLYAKETLVSSFETISLKLKFTFFFVAIMEYGSCIDNNIFYAKVLKYTQLLLQSFTALFLSLIEEFWINYGYHFIVLFWKYESTDPFNTKVETLDAISLHVKVYRFSI